MVLIVELASDGVYDLRLPASEVHYIRYKYYAKDGDASRGIAW